MSWLARLDAYGTEDRQFREGHPEDRCPVCECAVIAHPCADSMFHECEGQPALFPAVPYAKWPHRRAALRDIAFRYLTGAP